MFPDHTRVVGWDALDEGACSSLPSQVYELYTPSPSYYHIYVTRPLGNCSLPIYLSIIAPPPMPQGNIDDRVP